MKAPFACYHCVDLADSELIQNVQLCVDRVS